MAAAISETKAAVAENGAPEKVVKVAKTAAELQKMRVEKLMRKPEKPVYIPEKPEEKVARVFNPPEFIRNIWGSSAGAGSGDFHVYRGVRRREYARQKLSKEEAERLEKDAEYQEKLVANKKEAEERTAKKRAKRLKKKQKQKAKKSKKEDNKNGKDNDDDENESGEGDES